MKIAIYCQHVLGLGHFFRTLEIAGALAPDEVILITGGKKIDVRLDDHIRLFELPGLMMDENFDGLYSVDPGLTLGEVKSARSRMLVDLIKEEAPDVFLVELYPFGRRAFRFELEPALETIQNSQKNCRVVSSIRDILVEKEDVEKYETRVLKPLNRWFDAVLVHSDPELIRLDATFSRMSLIEVPIVYTGFVTPLPDPEKAQVIRKSLGLGKEEYLVVVSAGSGSVGEKLLKSAVLAHQKLPDAGRVDMQIFTGPYMGKKDVEEIRVLAKGGRISVETFHPDFISMLKAADLSISMGGYNTSMNIVAAKAKSLVWPFAQNREQRLRANQLTEFSDMTIIEDSDLESDSFASLIHQSLNSKNNVSIKKELNIFGARQTAKWIKEFHSS